MNESQNPTKQRDIAVLIVVVKEIIRYWEAIARRHFDAHPSAGPAAVEQHWSALLDNFFLAESIRVTKPLRQLSEGRDN